MLEDENKRLLINSSLLVHPTWPPRLCDLNLYGLIGVGGKNNLTGITINWVIRSDKYGIAASGIDKNRSLFSLHCIKSVSKEVDINVPR